MPATLNTTMRAPPCSQAPRKVPGPWSSRLVYLLRAATTLRLQVAYTDNKSNIVINQYDRTVVSLSSRFNF